MRGTWELLRARLRTVRLQPTDLPELNRAAQARGASADASGTSEVDRICFVIAVLARYLPWRSDCLPQALAGQNWLLARGIASVIQVGAERTASGDFGAHAWLVHNDRVVLGGDIDRFTPLVGGAGR
nr:lasso peptide biosynthesis B2 protein [Erythrobacter sp. JK5]